MKEDLATLNQANSKGNLLLKTERRTKSRDGLKEMAAKKTEFPTLQKKPRTFKYGRELITENR
jgi:hypothetical protein